MELKEHNKIRVFPKITAYADGTVSGRLRSMKFDNSNNIQNGSNEKRFRFTKSTKRQVTAKINAMAFAAPKNKLWFFTLTTSSNAKDNRPVMLYMQNLRKRKIVLQYVWVREKQKRGADHWHIIAHMCKDFTSYKIMRTAWNSALTHCGYLPSINSWRGGDKHGKVIVSDYRRASKYVSKYMSKSDSHQIVERIPTGRLDKNLLPQIEVITYQSFESYRVTHSSRIKYKGKIEIECFFKIPAPRIKYIQNGYVGVHVFEDNFLYHAHLVEAWRHSAEVDEYYTNLNLN